MKCSQKRFTPNALARCLVNALTGQGFQTWRNAPTPLSLRFHLFDQGAYIRLR